MECDSGQPGSKVGQTTALWDDAFGWRERDATRDATPVRPGRLGAARLHQVASGCIRSLVGMAWESTAVHASPPGRPCRRGALLRATAHHQKDWLDERERPYKAEGLGSTPRALTKAQVTAWILRQQIRALVLSRICPVQGKLLGPLLRTISGLALAPSCRRNLSSTSDRFRSAIDMSEDIKRKLEGQVVRSVA